MSQEEWFYELLSEELGPMSIRDIRMMINNGTLAPTDRIRQNGSAEWITAAELPESLSRDSGGADELSDLSELSFSFDPSGETLTDTASADELDINSFTFANDPVPETPDDHEGGFDDMGIDSFRIEGDADSEQPVTRGRQAEAEQEPGYFVEALGQILGPMPLSELIMMAESGAVSDSDRIRQGETGEWSSPLSVTEVAMGILAATRAAQKAGTSVGSVTASRLQSGSSPAEPPAANATLSAESTAGTLRQPREKRPTAKGRTRKKKEAKKDELLEEIFSDVFSEDGHVKDDSQRTDLKPSASISKDMTNSAAPAAPIIAAAPTSPTMPSPQPIPAAPAMSAAPPFSRPPTPPRTSPMPSVKKKSSGGGFSMPEPKFLGMIGGGLLAVMIAVAAMSGMVSLPGLAPDVDGFLNSVTTEYKQMSAGAIPPDKWKALKSRVNAEGREIITYYAKAGSLSSEQNKKRWAVAKLIELMSCDPADAEKRDKVFKAYEAM